MKRALVFVLVVSLLAGPAAAAELRVFFSQTGLSDEADTNSPIAGAPAQANPIVDVTGGPRRLYVWAQMMGEPATQAWDVLTLDFRVAGAVRITERLFWNYSVGGPRWDGVSQGTLASDGRELIGVAMVADTARGVNNSATTQSIDGQFDAGTNATLVGYLVVEGAGELFIGVGPFGIRRFRSTEPEPIHFGFGDEGDAIDGDDLGTYSSLADARTESLLGVDEGVAAATLRCIPNPSPGARVRIAYAGPRDAPLVLSISDLHGRLVERLELRQSSIEWQCRDRLGGPVPPGVYWVGVRAGAKLLARERLLVVR